QQHKRRERTEHSDRGAEQHAKRQRPALVKGGEDQEHENERYSEHDSWGYALLRFLFLKRQAKVVVAHFVRHGLSKSFLERVHCLVRAVAWCGRGNFSTNRSEEHTSELQSHLNLVCRLL